MNRDDNIDDSFSLPLGSLDLRSQIMIKNVEG